MAAWQIIVPIEATPRAPRSLIKIEFANVPAYETKPMPVRATPGLVQVQDTLANELEFVVELKGRIGHEKIDVIVRGPDHSPRGIDDVAVRTGIVL